MKREFFLPRHNYKLLLEEMGFDYHTIDGEAYWRDNAAYKFTAEEVEAFYQATETLINISFNAVDYIISNDMFHRLQIPAEWAAMIKKSWDKDDFTFYGRFDLGYNGKEIKLLEYNADTPTSFLESSIAQWGWMKDRALKDQFNSIHEKAIEQWSYFKKRYNPDKVYFTCAKESLEDFRNCEYIMDLAHQAGIKVSFLFLDQICSDGSFLYDTERFRIDHLFKLYPWEFLIHDEFSNVVLNGKCKLIEPAWKMLLSNKGLLPILWEMHPNHPLLLKSTFNASDFTNNYVKKPFLSREGANIEILRNGMTTKAQDFGYGDEGFVYQDYFKLPSFDGYTPVIGSWVIGDEQAGIGIREDKSIITGNNSSFIPHYIE